VASLLVEGSHILAEAGWEVKERVSQDILLVRQISKLTGMGNLPTINLAS
jgi:hypothetical protein